MLSREKRVAVQTCVDEGMTVRAIRSVTGCSMNAVLRYRKLRLLGYDLAASAPCVPPSFRLPPSEKVEPSKPKPTFEKVHEAVAEAQKKAIAPPRVIRDKPYSMFDGQTMAPKRNAPWRRVDQIGNGRF